MFTLGPHEILVGLGSNSKDALEKLREARLELRLCPHFRLKKCSPIYTSQALLPEGAPQEWDLPYLNAALLIELVDLPHHSLEDAQQIIQIFKDIEKKLGRGPSPRWSPRPIDLDLLDWNGPPLQGPEIFVPHKEILKRPFVLLPAEDCAPLKESSAQAKAWRYSWPKDVPFETKRAKASWPKLMTVINLTPDSFSDGGSYSEASSLEKSVRSALVQGATIIDVGAESTRPGGEIITPEEEWKRLHPHLSLLAELQKESAFKLSLDSRHPWVIKKVMEKIKLDWLNDVEGFVSTEMLELAKETSGPLVFMHSLSIPPSPEIVLPVEEDPVEELLFWGREKIELFENLGIDKRRLIFDPGLGFGKTLEQNYALIKGAKRFNELPVSTLIGHSRKRFLDPHGLIEASARDLETALFSGQLALSGIDVLRIHHTEFNQRALLLGNEL